MTRETYETSASVYAANSRKGLAIQKFSQTVAGKRGRLMFEEPKKIKDGYLCHPSSEAARLTELLWHVFGRELPVTSSFKTLYIAPNLQERQVLHADDHSTMEAIAASTKQQLEVNGPFSYSWSAFGALRVGQGLCLAGENFGKTHLTSEVADFHEFTPGDLIIILGNTAHGGSAYSQYENNWHRSLQAQLPTVSKPQALPDLKFFINCAGLNYAANPNAGTVTRQQLYLAREKDETHRAFLDKHQSYKPSVHYFNPP
jgi:hypothetical protein